MKNINKECRFKNDLKNKNNCNYSEKEKKKQETFTNNLCEILSSDDNNEKCDENNNNFIIVELISYICGNSKIISFYPSTYKNNSGQNKYLYHFYKKKKTKLYLCLNKKNNEIYIYEVQCKYTKKKNDTDDNIESNVNADKLNASIETNKKYIVKIENSDNNNSVNNQDNNFMHTCSYSCKDIPINNKLKEQKIKIENSTNISKKIFVTKLFDSINCSYDLSTIEYTKLSNTDDKTLHCLKNILEQKINKNAEKKKEEDKKGNMHLDFINRNNDTYNYDLNVQRCFNEDKNFYLKMNLNEKNVSNSEDIVNKNNDIKNEEKKKLNIKSDDEIKILFLHFHEPADIFMNQFANIDQSKDETFMKHIKGFLNDEKYKVIEKECSKLKKKKIYGSVIRKIKNADVPCSFLDNYESDISICSNDLFFSDSEVITRDCESDIKGNKKKNLNIFTRNNLKVKWILLNLNLKNEEEIMIQKYVICKKSNIEKLKNSNFCCNNLDNILLKNRKKNIRKEESAKYIVKNNDMLKNKKNKNDGVFEYLNKIHKYYHNEGKIKNKKEIDDHHLIYNFHLDEDVTDKTKKENEQQKQETKEKKTDKDEEEKEKEKKRKGKEEYNSGNENSYYEIEKIKKNYNSENEKKYYKLEKVKKNYDSENEKKCYKSEKRKISYILENEKENVLKNKIDIKDETNENENIFKDKNSTLCENNEKGDLHLHIDCNLFIENLSSKHGKTDIYENESLEINNNTKKRKITNIVNHYDIPINDKKIMIEKKKKTEDVIVDTKNKKVNKGEIMYKEENNINDSTTKDKNQTNVLKHISCNSELKSNCEGFVFAKSDVLLENKFMNEDYIKEENNYERWKNCYFKNNSNNENEFTILKNSNNNNNNINKNNTKNNNSSNNNNDNSNSNNSISSSSDVINKCCNNIDDSNNTGSGNNKNNQDAIDDGISNDNERNNKIDNNNSNNNNENDNSRRNKTCKMNQLQKDDMMKLRNNNNENKKNKESNEFENCFFLKCKVNTFFDIIKIIYCNYRHFRYTDKLKFYITTFLNFSKIEKAKLQFMHKEKIIDTEILKYYINKKTLEKKNVWKLNNYKIDNFNIFRLNKSKYIDDSIIDFFNNYIYSFVLNFDKDKNDIYIFNTFFYKKIELYDDIFKAYINTNRWIKKLKKKIYEYRYVFIPINIKNTHWSLVLLYFPFNNTQENLNKTVENSINSIENYKCKKSMNTTNEHDSNCYIEGSYKNKEFSKSDMRILITDNDYCKEKIENSYEKFRNKSNESFFLKKRPLKNNKYNILKNYFNYLDENNNKEYYYNQFPRSLSDVGESTTKFSKGEFLEKNELNSLSDKICLNKKKKLKIEKKNSKNIKIAYMIYLDSLLPSVKGNKIMQKLKKYVEHIFILDQMKMNKKEMKNKKTDIQKIFFKFIYPSVIPKQSNSYDCGIYIIQFILHLCLNKHIVENDLIKPFKQQVKNKFINQKFHFNFSNENFDNCVYSKLSINKSIPWFGQKDISIKRKQMKKMLLYMKDVINWKSDNHIEALNLLFLMNYNKEYKKNPTED